MNKTTKKVLALVLMMIMILSSVPMTSFAANPLCSVIGHDLKWVETTAATCSSAGEETEKCDRVGCDYTTGNKKSTSVKSHTYVTIPAAEPTCDKVGNTEGSYCSTCGAVTKECEPIPSPGHTPVALPAKEATCDKNGNTAGTKCSVCDTILTGGVVIPATDHDYKLVSFKAGSCKEEGKEEYKCRNCGHEKVDKIKADHNYGSWTVITQATCTTKGRMERVCKDCEGREQGGRESKEVDKIPHTEVVVFAKDATCTEAGMTAGKKCTICNTVTDGCEPLAALGHKEKIVAGTPATCGVKGLSDSAYCEVCKEVTRAQVEIAALEHIITVTALIQANCNSEGSKTEKCTRIGCTYEKTTVIPKTHEVNWTVDKRATCTADGTQSGYCTACKKTVVEVIPALGHLVTNALSWRVTVPPTCTKEGKRVANCARSGCGGQAEEILPALDHQETIYKSAVAATCSKAGSTESKQCTVCKAITVESEVIPKLEHTYGEWTVTKTATCKVSGVKEAVCTVCSEKIIETLDRLPHTEVVTEAKEATCTEAGNTKGVVCSECNTEIEKLKEIPALGHDHIKDETKSVDPTCVLEGKFYGTCSRCDNIKDEIVPAKGHDEEIYAGTPADCTLTGLSEGKKCKVCGEITAEPQQTPALGHDFIMQPDKSKPATCTENGFEYLACSRCEAVDQTETTATGHSFGDWAVTKEPTCDKQGTKTRVCVSCNYEDTQPVESLGSHNIVTMPAVEATCTTDGMTQGLYCDKCNEVFETQEVQPAFGHKTDGVDPTLTPATTKKEGSFAIACERCNELVNPQVIAKIDEKSIKLSTEKCTYNGKKRTPSVTVKDVNGKVLEKDTDYTVKYDSGRTKVGEYNIKVTFKGNYSGSKTLIFTIAPGKTSKITATSSQKDYVKLSWKAVEGATGYRVYVYETVEGKTRKKVASVTGTTYNLKKDYLGDTMAVGAKYKIAVTAYTKLEDGTVIHALAGVAKTFTRTPGKPSLTVTSASGKANLKWTNVDDETGYQVYYATKEDGDYTKLVSQTKNEYSKAFTKGKTLYFKVRAYTKVDGEVVYGSFSTVQKVTIK